MLRAVALQRLAAWPAGLIDAARPWQIGEFLAHLTRRTVTVRDDPRWQEPVAVVLGPSLLPRRPPAVGAAGPRAIPARHAPA